MKRKQRSQDGNNKVNRDIETAGKGQETVGNRPARTSPHGGIRLGSLAAQTGLSIASGKLTLYQAMERLHQAKGIDIFFVSGGSSPTSLDMQDGPPLKLAASAAQKFGKDITEVQHIVVLQDALPDAGSGQDRFRAALEWLGTESPDDGSALDERGARAMSSFLDALDAEKKRIAAGLNGRELQFSQLSDAQRQSMVDMMRANRLYFEAARFNNMFGEFREDQAKPQ